MGVGVGVGVGEPVGVGLTDGVPLALGDGLGDGGDVGPVLGVALGPDGFGQTGWVQTGSGRMCSAPVCLRSRAGWGLLLAARPEPSRWVTMTDWIRAGPGAR